MLTSPSPDAGRGRILINSTSRSGRTKQTKSGLLTYYHHVFNSHHLASPEDWQIIGPVVGPVWKNESRRLRLR